MTEDLDGGWEALLDEGTPSPTKKARAMYTARGDNHNRETLPILSPTVIRETDGDKELYHPSITPPPSAGTRSAASIIPSSIPPLGHPDALNDVPTIRPGSVDTTTPTIPRAPTAPYFPLSPFALLPPTQPTRETLPREKQATHYMTAPSLAIDTHTTNGHIVPDIGDMIFTPAPPAPDRFESFTDTELEELLSAFHADYAAPPVTTAKSTAPAIVSTINTSNCVKPAPKKITWSAFTPPLPEPSALERLATIKDSLLNACRGTIATIRKRATALLSSYTTGNKSSAGLADKKTATIHSAFSGHDFNTHLDPSERAFFMPKANRARFKEKLLAGLQSVRSTFKNAISAATKPTKVTPYPKTGLTFATLSLAAIATLTHVSSPSPSSIKETQSTAITRSSVSANNTGRSIQQASTTISTNIDRAEHITPTAVPPSYRLNQTIYLQGDPNIPDTFLSALYGYLHNPQLSTHISGYHYSRNLASHMWQQLQEHQPEIATKISGNRRGYSFQFALDSRGTVILRQARTARQHNQLSAPIALGQLATR